MASLYCEAVASRFVFNSNACQREEKARATFHRVDYGCSSQLAAIKRASLAEVRVQLTRSSLSRQNATLNSRANILATETVLRRFS